MAGDTENNTSGGQSTRRWPLIALGALIVASMGAICALGYTLLDTNGILDRFGSDESEAEIEPTPFQQPGGGSAAASNEPIVYGISDNSTISVTLDAPATLSIADRDFVVIQQSINPDGELSPGISSESAAGWVYGSIVNYIMALQDTQDNNEFLQSLFPGTEIILTTQSGSDFVFKVEGARQVAVEDQTVFSQLSPGITLVLMGEGNEEEERMVVNGQYVSSDSPSGSGAGETSTEVGLGEAVLLDGLRLTVNNATYVPDHPDAPPGFAFFVLDGVVQNNDEATVDAGVLQLVLVDEVGNRYVLNPIASRLGDSPPLTGGFLAAGQSLPFSVGYQIPAGLSSTQLTAQVMRTDSGAGVQVKIPFGGSSAAESVQISLLSVEVSEDLTTMTLTGQITSTGDQPLVISQSDVTLRTPDGASYLVLSSNPPFPWTIPAGQTLQYAVTFQRPLTSASAIFTVLNQPFQLDNLQ